MNEKLYPEQDPRKLEPYFGRHMLAMTAEGLHDKSAIAEQLAWRDQEIETLKADYRRLVRAYARLASGADRPDVLADAVRLSARTLKARQ